jgi:hypothetical protein
MEPETQACAIARSFVLDSCHCNKHMIVYIPSLQESGSGITEQEFSQQKVCSCRTIQISQRCSQWDSVRILDYCWAISPPESLAVQLIHHLSCHRQIWLLTSDQIHQSQCQFVHAQTARSAFTASPQALVSLLRLHKRHYSFPQSSHTDRHNQRRST